MARPNQEQFSSIYDQPDKTDVKPLPLPDKSPEFDSVSRYFFFKKLADKARSVIEPVMRKINLDLQKQGHRSVIFQEIEATIVDDSVHPAHISFIIFTEDGKPAYDLSRYPHIAFVASSDKNTVWIRKKIKEKHDSREINAGEYKISAITSQVVEKHIQEFLSEVIAKDRHTDGSSHRMSAQKS